jgi:hypothetical protein
MVMVGVGGLADRGYGRSWAERPSTPKNEQNGGSYITIENLVGKNPTTTMPRPYLRI